MESLSSIAENIAQVHALERALAEQTLQEYPGSVVGNLFMAQVLRHHGDSELALDFYQKALAIDAKRDDIYCEMAQIAQEKGKIEDALETLVKGLEQVPESSDLRWDMANILFEQGQYDRALDHLEEARALTPDETRVYYLLGQVYSKLGRVDQAEESYKKTIALDPKHQNAYYGLGMLYSKSKQRDLAKAMLSTFRRLQEDSPTYRAERDPKLDITRARERAAGFCFRSHLLFLQKRNFVVSKQLLEKSAELDPANASYVERLALIAYETMDYDTALHLFEKARQLNPRKAAYSLNLSKIHQQQGRLNDAVETLREAIKQFPDEPLVYTQLAQLYLQSRRHIRWAILLLQKALELKVTGQNYYLLSNAYSSAGLNLPAMAAIETAMALEPYNLQYWGFYEQIKPEP